MISEKLGVFVEFRDVGVIFSYLWEFKSLPQMGKCAIIMKSYGPIWEDGTSFSRNWSCPS